MLRLIVEIHTFRLDFEWLQMPPLYELSEVISEFWSAASHSLKE
jgi:hypothetical protein